MPLLEQQPIHVRKKIALGITLGIGLVLVITMVFVYSPHKKEVRGPDGATTAIGRFYATILSYTQSYFEGGHVIIPK